MDVKPICQEWNVDEERISTMFWPKALKLEFFIRPLLQRSYELFTKNNRKDVTSEYMSGNIIVVTTFKERVMQIVFAKEEIGDLPAECQRLLKQSLASKPAIKGHVIARL